MRAGSDGKGTKRVAWRNKGSGACFPSVLADFVDQYCFELKGFPFCMVLSGNARCFCTFDDLDFPPLYTVLFGPAAIDLISTLHRQLRTSLRANGNEYKLSYYTVAFLYS